MSDASGRPALIHDLTALRDGGKRGVAEALAAIERNAGAAGIAALLDEAYLAPRAHVIGFTGPPGVGKSSLIHVLMRRWRAAGIRIGVIAVDPSSQKTQGALLGDRIRMRSDPADQGVFVRSLASRGRLGGLAEMAYPATILMRALYDRVIVETVGVGQSEADISALADSVVLCVQPGSGDSLQFMKAGIMEIPDLAVVTKADSGAAARRAYADLRGALGLASGGEVDCLLLSANTGEGLSALSDKIETRAVMEPGALAARRHAQAESWLLSTLRQRFGEAGVEAAGAAASLAQGCSPFGHARALLGRLSVHFVV